MRSLIILILSFSLSGFLFGQLHHFSIEQSGGGAIPAQTAGIPLFIQVVAQDSVNNTVTEFSGTVDVSSNGILSSGVGATPAFIAGVLDSHMVVFSNTGIFSLTAIQTGDTFSGSSNTFNVAASSPFLIQILQQPSPTIAGAIITPSITAQLKDSLGNDALVGGINISVSLTSGSGTPGGTITQATDAQGLATFDNIFITTSGAKTLAVSGSGLLPDTSVTFSITPGILHHFLVESSTGVAIPDQTAGISFLIGASAQDTFNNTVSSFTGSVDITSTGNLTTGGGTTLPFTAGILSSHSVAISPGGNFTITAIQTAGSISGTSNTFTVNNSSPSTVSISPTSKTTGEPGFVITINGSNFNTASVVRFNGSDRTTIFNNSTQLTATILSSDIDTSGSFPVTVFTPAPGGGTSTAQQLLVNPPVVNAKIYLEGPFSGSTMSTALRTGNLIPLTQPYNIAPFTFTGTENVVSIPANVVDWVLLELRTGTGSASRVARRAAFIRNDGVIVDLNGTSPVSFPTAPLGNYFIVIHHRNHLSVMTPSAVTLSQSSTLYDFSTGLTQYFGGSAKALGGGRFGMYGGDYSSDGFLDAADFIGPDNDVFLTGYRKSDLNLDGFVDVSDFAFPDNNVFIGTNVPN
jgi:hypothetical protein